MPIREQYESLQYHFAPRCLTFSSHSRPKFHSMPVPHQQVPPETKQQTILPN